MSNRQKTLPVKEHNNFNEHNSSIEESDLVIHAQHGDQIAFEKLYERYVDRLNRYVTRLVDDEGIAADLSQETFLKVWEALPGLQNPSCFPSWLYQIAKHKAYNYQNRARHMRIVPWEERSLDQARINIAGPERQIEEAELIQRVLARVSPTYRPCLLLSVMEHLPQQHIAHALGIKASSVSTYVRRGKEEFRQIYDHLL